METKDFLDAVLPVEGKRCFVHIRNTAVTQRITDDTTELAEALHGHMSEGEVYFGCAAYNNSGGRKASDVTAVRSFWLDLDTQEGKPKERYVNRREALADLIKFTSDIGLPVPTLVDSGYGIHAYWVCTEDFSPFEWQGTAAKLKAATVKWGLAADPTRTADVASILRAVGTINNKKPEDPRPVRLIAMGQESEYADIDAILTDYVGDVPVHTKHTKSEKGPSLNADLIGEREFPPSDPNQMADHCAVMGEIRETRGDLEEPLWYAGIGALIHTTDGVRFAHEWSKGYAGYSAAETQTRIERSRELTGPSSCERLSGYRPAVCAACKFKGKITSPVELGREDTGLIPVEVVIPQPKGVTPVKTLIEFPKGYGYGKLEGGSDDVLYYTHYEKLVNEDGSEVWIDTKKFLADYLLYPTHRVSDTKENYSMNLRLVSPAIAERNFHVDNATISEGGNKLFSILGSKEANVSRTVRPQFEKYLHDWISKLREEFEATPMVPQFGWYGDGFVIGEDYITPTGTRKALLSAGATKKAKFLTSKGDIATWVKTVDTIYNHKGDEALQYCLISAFAGPLWKLLGEDGGTIVHAYSTGSGFGKTTAQLVGMSAFGFKDRLYLKADGATKNALYNHAGLMGNLPVIIDEVTRAAPWLLSELAFTISSGLGKARLDQDIVERDTLDWSTITLTSGHLALSEQFAQLRGDASGEIMRVWEFRCTKKGTVSVNEAADLFAAFRENHGVAGRLYIEYLVQNRQAIEKMLRELRKSFNTEVGMRQEERYWSMVNTCVLGALAICRKLGLVNFEHAAMLTWIKSTLEMNRANKVESTAEPLELFGDMLADLAPSILVTMGNGSLRSQPASVVRHPRGGAIVGRNSLATGGNTRETLHISVGAIREWCTKRGTSSREMFNAARAARWVDPVIAKPVLGAGTVEYSGMTGQVRCWDILVDNIKADQANIPTAARVVLAVANDLDATGSD